MIDPNSQSQLRDEIAKRIATDRVILDCLRNEIHALKSSVRRIQPRSAAAISLVAADGGNNSLQFDPFLVHLVRIVDSSNNQYCLDVVTPSTDVSELSRRQFDPNGSPITALGELMAYLGVSDLTRLSHMIRRHDDQRPASPSWVQVYRELVEWAVLFSLVRNKDFGTDTLIVADGLLRSKVFAGDLFRRYLDGLAEGIRSHESRSRRKVFLVGVAKHSKVLDRYRLAMTLEDVLTTDYPAFVEVPREIEERSYVWSEWAKGNDRETASTEINKFVGGKLFLVKFGSGRRDPIWPIDVFVPQRAEAPAVLGYMLGDAINGFPIPFYPQCLQRAHEHAALVAFDFDVLQDYVFDGIRSSLGERAAALDAFRLQAADPSQRRY